MRPSVVSVPTMFPTPESVYPLTSSKAIILDQEKSGPRRKTDSYRPDNKCGAPSRLYTSKSWHRTSSCCMTLTSKPLPGQSEDHSHPGPSKSNKDSPRTKHNQEHLDPKPTNKRRHTSMTNTSPSPSPSNIVDPNTREISEAQSRGIYRSPQSPAPKIDHLGPYSINTHSNNETTERSLKRFRGTEEEEMTGLLERRKQLDYRGMKRLLSLAQVHQGVSPTHWAAHEPLES